MLVQGSAIATSNRKNRMQARRPEARPKKESASPPRREKMLHAFYNDFIDRCKKRSCNKISRNVSIYRSNSVLTFIERLQPTVGSDVRSFKYQFIISAQQYFQQKFNMTTPNSYLSRYSQFQYPLALSPWAIGASNPYAFNPQLSYPSFPQPLNYSYFMPPNAFYPHLQANQMFAGAFPSQPVAQTGAVVRAEERSIGASNKIQKNQKRAQESSVIQISDDQQPAQQGKPCQEKSTSSNNKIIHNDPPINNKTIHHLQKQQPPNPKKQPIPTTTPKHIKPPKTKEICKINNLKKKLKSETLNQECQQKKGQVFSQRIIEKKDAKKQPYRLSKKQRQLLEISFLRDVANEILTGPQFQAKLPSFIVQPSPSFGSSHDLQNWKQQLRADLLSRMEKNQE